MTHLKEFHTVDDKMYVIYMKELNFKMKKKVIFLKFSKFSELAEIHQSPSRLDSKQRKKIFALKFFVLTN